LPVKEAKLTRYIQTGFVQNSQVVLCVNICREDAQHYDNLSAIQFAERSKNLEFKSKLLDEQMNIGQNQNLEKQLKAVCNEIRTFEGKMVTLKKCIFV